MIPYSLNSKDVKKGTCPSCGYGNRFSYYVNNETLEKIGDGYGKCDRIENCKYHLVPGKDCVSLSDNYIPPSPKPILFHPYDLVIESRTNFKENDFVQFLNSLAGETQTKDAISKYRIGTSKKWQGVVFWQIDSKNRVHHGKIMAYDKITGKRIKSESGRALISSVRAEQKLYDYELNQCLFGLHLVDENPRKPVAVVEAEKTAVIMSIWMPQYIWTSTGSEQGFKYNMLEPIKNHRIVAYPDKGCFDSWKETATKLNSLGFDISVSETLEMRNVINGSDLADIFIDEKKIFQSKVKQLPESTKSPSIIIPPTVKKYDKDFTLDDYELCKSFVLSEKSNEEKTCFDLDGNRITQNQSDQLIKLMQS